ncbi:unnamed protein product [Urochloa humidicola]
MGRHRPGSRAVVVEVTLLGSDLAAPQVQAAEGSSRSRGSKRKVRPEKFKVRGVSSRCSFSQVYEAIQGFNERQKQLVEETGFGGLLSFPALWQVDRMFVVWLMCRVDALEHCIVIDQSRKIKFGKEDVRYVFGIPSGGRAVPVNPRPTKELMARVWCDMVGMKDSGDRRLKSLLEVVTRDYGSEMSESECISFKVAFVIYMMSTVLAPGSRYDHVYLDYVEALFDHNEISSYDWSGFVYRKLLDAITQMKIGLRSKKKVVNITGCSLFLQVIYLDSIDLGVWNMEHKTFPRVKDFAADRIKYMIRADTLENTEDSTDRVFGTRQLLPASKVCYSWATVVDRSSIVARDEMKNSLLDATASLARLFSIDIEGATSLFEAVAGIDMGNPAKIVAEVASFLQPYVRSGSVRQEGALCGKCFGVDLSGGHVSCHHQAGASSAVGSSILRGQRGSADVLGSIGGLSMNSGTFMEEADGSGDECDIGAGNSIGADNLVCRNGLDGTFLGDGCFQLKDPWELGFSFSYYNVAAGVMLSEICAVYGNSLASSVPGFWQRDVGLILSEMEAKIFGGMELPAGVVDAVLRCIKFRDASIYARYGRVRWRHFVATGFMEAVVRGNFDATGYLARFNFDSSWVGYDVSLCRLVFFPYLLNERWVCYAWKPTVDEWVVFDPIAVHSDMVQCSEFHAGIIQQIRDAIRGMQCLSSFVWRDICGKPYVSVLNYDDRFPRTTRTGVGCLYFCSMYDGVSIRGDVCVGDGGSNAQLTLADVLESFRFLQACL